MKSNMFSIIQRVAREAPPDLQCLARRGLPSAIGAICLGNVLRLVAAFVEGPAVFSLLPWQVLVLLCLLGVVQLAGGGYAIVRPPLALCCLAGVVGLQLVLQAAGIADLQAALPHSFRSVMFLFGLPSGLINLALAALLCWATRRSVRTGSGADGSTPLV